MKNKQNTQIIGENKPIKIETDNSDLIKIASKIVLPGQKEKNAETQSLEQGLPIPVVITVFSDKSFKFIKKTPPAAVLLKKAAGITKGSSVPNRDKVAKVTRAQLEEIANTKEPDLSSYNMDAAVKIIAGSARSMGIEVED